MPSNIQNDRLYYIFDRGDKQLRRDNRQLLREKYEMGRAVRKMRESRDRWRLVSKLILAAWIFSVLIQKYLFNLSNVGH